MKTFIPYAMVFLLSTGAAAVIVAGMVLVKPELFQTAAALPADSVAAPAGREGAPGAPPEARGDGVQTQRTPADSARVSMSPAAQQADSVSAPPAAKSGVSAATAEFSPSAMDSTRTRTAGADSTRGEEHKSMAKVLEAMDPESAARILNGFPDGDVKQIILTIKRRQAAKILAALDPDRAARIMR